MVDDGYLRLRIDLEQPEEVQKRVKESFGIPSVVVYNGIDSFQIDLYIDTDIILY